MKKITLKENEVIQHKVGFGKRVLIIDIFFIVLIIYINASLNLSMRSHFIFSIILMVFTLIPLVIKTILDFLRVFTHRVYVTNQTIYIIKGYFYKRIICISLDDLFGIYHKQSIFDRRMGLLNIKLKERNDKEYVLKGTQNSAPFLDYITRSLLDRKEKSQSPA